MTQQSRDDYWTAGRRFQLTCDRIFTGPSGLRQLSAAATLTAPRPALFRARLSRLQLDHVALEAFEAGAHSGRIPLTDAREPSSCSVEIALILEGRAVVAVDANRFELRPGDVAITDSRDELWYSVPEGFSVLRCVVGLEHLPQALQVRSNTHGAALRTTPLTKSFFSFINTMLGHPEQVAAATSPVLLTALIDLQTALLHEAGGRSGDSDGPEDLRGRMREHIDLHFQDPELDPTAVADAVGISTRSAHALFHEAEHTLAREIRERRLDAVARDLLIAGRASTVAALAQRWGFSGPDVLTRAFRHRYGLTPWQYLDSRRRQP